jgi:hypothetical protein
VALDPQELATAAREVGSPEWWVLRLLHQLEQRIAATSLWGDYYDGLQPLAFASRKFEEAFGSRFPAFSSNFCGLVGDSIAERYEVQSFRGYGKDDALVWRMWQENDCDAGSQQAFLEAMVAGTAYGLVEPSTSGLPVITFEDASDCIVAADPKYRRKRRAGLKRWIDDDGHLVVVLYLPEEVRKYRSRAAWPAGGLEWKQYAPEAAGGNAGTGAMWMGSGLEPWQPEGDEEWPLPNPMGVVPLVELPNRPRLKPVLPGGQSEIKPIRSNQDATNKYRADALIASEFAAFPQRYLLNYEPDVDPDTGRSIEPFRAAIDRIITVPPNATPDNPDAPEPKIGSLPAASLEPYRAMIELEVGHIASISRVPYHYLLPTPTSLPPSGESTKSAEAGLEHKVGRGRMFLGEGLEELARVALMAEKGTREAPTGGETVWVDTETRNEAVRTDAIVKLHAEGVIDDELAWELAGLTPEQVRALAERQAKRKTEEAAQAERAALEEVERQRELQAADAGAAVPGQPPRVVPAPTGPRMGA